MTTPTADKPLSGCRILIVEDDFLIAQNIAEIVEDAGAKIVGPFATMIGALDGLTMLDAIDGAILDVGLGNEDSYPLAEALQTTRIPFMFLTGRAKLHVPERFASAGHLLKPFSQSQLIRALLDLRMGSS